MKIQGVIFWVAIIAAFILNGVYWHINWMFFTGYVLIAVILFGFALSIVFKLILKRSGEKNAFIFPDAMAKGMKNIQMKTQLESTLLAQFFMVFGVGAFAVYYLFFTDSTWAVKGLIVFNTLCGLALLRASLISSYQSYVSFMSINETIQEQIKNNPDLFRSVEQSTELKGGLQTNG